MSNTQTIDWSNYAAPASPAGTAQSSPQIDFSKYEQGQQQSQQAQPGSESPARELSIWGGGNAQDAAIMGETQKQYPTLTSPKTIGAVGGSIIAPELAPEGGWLAHALLTGIGAGAGTSGGQALSGQDPTTSASLQESGTNAAMFGLTDLLFGGPSALAKTKLGRSFINESVGATGRDVIYGNPAKAMTDENITSPFTGDIEKVKAAGGNLQAAGGRLGQVAQRVSQLKPQLDQALSASPKTVKVSNVIDKPLSDALNDIINHGAMTDQEKMAAITQLGGLQASLKAGLGSDISVPQANQLKNMVGSRIRWNGTNAIGDEVKPAYKAVYGAMKDGVNSAVPEMAGLNERLTNLYSAQDDLVRLARNEEVSRGAGALRGTIGTNLLGRAESAAGRFIPGAASIAGNTGAAVKPILPAVTQSRFPPLGSPLNPDVTVKQ